MTAVRLTGREPFHHAGQQLDHRVLDLWRWADSELLSNALQGAAYEVLVSARVGQGVKGERYAFVWRQDAVQALGEEVTWVEPYQVSDRLRCLCQTWCV